MIALRAKLGFRGWLLVTFLTASVLPLAVGTLVGDEVVSRATQNQVNRQLESMVAAKGQQVHSYLTQIHDQVVTLSESWMTIEAMVDFTTAFEALTEQAEPAQVAAATKALDDFYRSAFSAKYTAINGSAVDIEQLIPTDDRVRIAQGNYIATNPHPLGRKDALTKIGDGSRYDELHAKYHPRFRSFQQKFGFYDIFLVEPEHGHVVYSVFKESDYGTSLLSGPYRGSNFARVFRAAAAAKDASFVAVEDFAPYRPSYEAPASFIASPIFDRQTLVGVLVFQMPVDRINEVMQQSAGLGTTGEIVLLGPDRKLRSQSRLSEEPTILVKQLDHSGALEASRGDQGFDVVGSEGERSLVAFAPLDFGGLRWSVLASISADEALAALGRIRLSGVAVLLGMLAISLPLVLWYVSRVRRQLGADPLVLATFAEAIAKGEEPVHRTEQPATGVYASMIEMHGELQARAYQERELAEAQDGIIKDTERVLGAVARGDLTERIQRDYEGAFGRIKLDVNATVDKLIEVTREIKRSAHQVSWDARSLAEGNANVSDQAEEQAANLEETASSMEQMTSTVRQNAENAQQANHLAETAKGEAERGGEVMDRLVTSMAGINASSKQISDIISVIDEIAFQTNLLALNASVEAARAGEQGRGFAVVASEVRNLAGRSAAAAKEIKELIQDSVRKVDQGSDLVDQSGAALGEIVLAVNKVTSIVAEIASANRQQSAGIEQVNLSVAQMEGRTQQNAALVEEAAAASASLGDQAQRLQELVAYFHLGDTDSETGTGADTGTGSGQRVVGAANHPGKGEPITGGRSASAGARLAESPTVLPERRSATRPWSDRESSGEGASPARPSRPVSAEDQDWIEF